MLVIQSHWAALDLARAWSGEKVASISGNHLVVALRSKSPNASKAKNHTNNTLSSART